MEIYSSAAEQASTATETPVYRSRARLLAGVIFWALMLLFFGKVALEVQTQTVKLVFSLVLVLFCAWQVVRCLKGSMNTSTPALIFSRAGIKQTDGKLIEWDSIVENRFIENTRIGFTFSKQIMLKVGQPPKPVFIPATSLQVSGDEYLALCERYHPKQG